MNRPQIARQPQAAIARQTPLVRPHQAARTPGDELPPSARGADPTSRSANTNSRPSKVASVSRWIQWAFIAAAALGGMSFVPLHNQEASSSNWSQHQAVGRGQSTKWVSQSGATTGINGVAVGQADLQPQVTRQIQERLRFGSLDAANQILRAANADLAQATQGLAGRVGAAVQPTLSPKLAQQLARGESRIFQVHLSDSCFEDGDVVELVINGQPFATIPITNRGVFVSLPLANDGTSQVVVRGVYDGGGGITVACETSQGTGFVRVLGPGESQAVTFTTH